MSVSDNCVLGLGPSAAEGFAQSYLEPKGMSHLLETCTAVTRHAG